MIHFLSPPELTGGGGNQQHFSDKHAKLQGRGNKKEKKNLEKAELPIPPTSVCEE
jgi:hypothetical protein